MPNVYGYVQEKYWNVGFLTYWEIKQIPNFLLGLPMIIISLLAIFKYIRADIRRFFTFCVQCHDIKISKDFASNPLIMPFIVYWVFNFVIIVFVANTQIITRMLCSMPALYWFICDSLYTKNKWVLFYFLAYLLIGTHLFSNFYPWT